MAATDFPATVVVPARDEEYAIGGCLRALREQSVGAQSLEVIVVVAGTDQTAAIARREGEGRFGRFEVVQLESGNKNVALQTGCRRAQADVIVLVDADTELEPAAMDELLRALHRDPHCVVHGAALPRIDTWVSRYWELNRQIVKQVHFDGNLSGELAALPRAALPAAELDQLLPADVSAQDDLYLGRMLRDRGWQIAYAPEARATTLVPWTLRGLLRTMLRSRRGLMRLLPFREAGLQAGKSTLVVVGAPLAVAVWRWSRWLALASMIPLLLHVVMVSRQVLTTQRRRPGGARGALPAFLLFDLLGRALKVWAFVERIVGRNESVPFRGERPAGVGSAQQSSHPRENGADIPRIARQS